MGEKDAAKRECDKCKKKYGPAIIVLKLDLHCKHYAEIVIQAVRHLDGVKDVKADIASNKLTVTGKVDPAKVKARVEEKFHKKVEIISPQPKKDDAKPEKKPNDKQVADKKSKEPQASRVFLRIRLHGDGCKQKIERAIRKVKGVDSVTFYESKNLVKVKGTVDTKKLVPYLKEKLNQDVEVVPPKKEEGGSEKKEKEGGRDKKKDVGVAKTTSSGRDGKKCKEANVVVNITINNINIFPYPPYTPLAHPFKGSQESAFYGNGFLRHAMHLAMHGRENLNH